MTLKFVLPVNNGDASKKTSARGISDHPILRSKLCKLFFVCSVKTLYPSDIASWNVHFSWSVFIKIQRYLWKWDRSLKLRYHFSVAFVSSKLLSDPSPIIALCSKGWHLKKKAITKCSTLKVDFSANFHLTHDFFWRRLSQHPKNWKTQKGIYKYQFKGV